jgi:membrane-associated phospholipid phosphatase
VALAALFVILAYEVANNPAVTSLDARIAEAVVARRSPGLDLFLWGVTLLGNALVLGTMATATVIVLVAWGMRSRAIVTAGTLIVAEVISSLVKYAYQRPRPPETIMLIEPPLSQSFPSGHAFLTLSFAALLVFLAFRQIRPLPGGTDARPWLRAVFGAAVIVTALAFVLLVGFSRVYLGVHWTSDVLAGWCLGGACPAAALAGLLLWERSPQAWRDARPWGSRKVRTVLVMALAVLVVAAYIIAAIADPLLV